MPALQRLRTLVSMGSDEGGRPELLAAVAGQLAPEPLLAAERADLLCRMVDGASEPDTLLERLESLVGALEDAGVTVAVQTAGRLRTSWAHRARPQHTEALLAAADRLSRDGGAASGLLAFGLVSGTGSALGWPEEWRSLLRRLRGHAHPDVRPEAYRTVTESE